MKLSIHRVFYVNQKVPKQEEGATYKKAGNTDTLEKCIANTRNGLKACVVIDKPYQF